MAGGGINSADPTAGDTSGRYVRVFNTEDTAAPPYAALEVCGYDKEENTFYVCKPTVSGRNDCLFNGRTPIRAQKAGQAIIGAGEIAALYAPDGTTPEPGELWGTKAGEWYLTPQSTGYVVRFLVSTNRSTLVVTRAPSSLREALRITGVNPGGRVPQTYYPAVVQKLNVETDEYEDTIVTCWFRDLYGEEPSVGERISCTHVGNGGPADNYRPLYEGRTEEVGDGGSSSGSGSSSGPTVVTVVECYPGSGLLVVSGTLSGTVTIRGRSYPVTLAVAT